MSRLVSIAPSALDWFGYGVRYRSSQAPALVRTALALSQAQAPELVRTALALSPTQSFFRPFYFCFRKVHANAGQTHTAWMRRSQWGPF